MGFGRSRYNGRMDRRRFLAALGLSAGAVTGVGGTSLVRAASDPQEEPPATAPATDPVGRAADEQAQVPHEGVHRVLWSVHTDQPVAALTFDDGPHPDLTPAILKILADFGVRATFLMMGYSATQRPDLARQVLDAGHEIGNHSWSHLNLARQTAEVTQAEIERGAAAIAAATGVNTTLFRPPRGQLSAWSVRYAALTGHDTVMWSHTRGAEGLASPEAVAEHLRQVGPGHVVCLHDGIGRGEFNPDAPFTGELRARRIVEIAALPRVLQEAADRGLRFGTVSDLLAVESGAHGSPQQEQRSA